MAQYWMDHRGAGLVDGVGWAGGPVEVDGRRAVGEVTLLDRTALAARLAAAGHPAPPAAGDLELLTRCLLHLGSAGLRTVDGMFTLAVHGHDGLTLVRDHVGTRPAYRARTPNGWTVASSLAALRNRAGMSWRVDVPAVATFLTFAYLPGEQTLVQDVAELLPGRVTTLGPAGTVTSETFWEPHEEIVDGPPDRHARRLRAGLEQAVAARLPAGEPVAATLSGGIDSSLVTALAATLHSHPVHTYSIGFGDELPNELAYSGLVATHCATVHRELRVDGAQVAGRLAETVALLDNPVGDPLTVPNLLLAEAVAADGITVALNGEGGDPVFGGPKNLPMLLFELHRGDPDPHARADAYLRSYRKCGADLPRLLTADAFAAAGPPPRELVAPYLDGPMTAQLDRLLHANIRTKGAHHILPKVERLTAACGVQARAPLFDRRVVDLAFTVPPRLKLAHGQEKWVLKESVADLLPDTIVRRPKSGMRVPVQQWLRGPLRELAGDALLSRSADRGLLRRDVVAGWLAGRGSLYPRHGAKVWLALTLELWLRAHVD